MSLITLTTDFGTRDWFVGTMRGVMLGINPRVRIVDICHEIRAGDIRAGAFALACAFRFFPVGTIHVAVVDPGVGGSRGAIVVKTDFHSFVGPDNGLLSWAAGDEVRSVHRIENETLWRRRVSRTFHGRDVFAPVAAHLSRGTPVAKVGPELSDWHRLRWPAPVRTRSGLEGEILHVDTFGNAITNIAGETMEREGFRRGVYLRGRRLCGFAEFYGAASVGKPVAVIGSAGFLELAVRDGNAAARYKLKAGDKLEVR